ncbi:MAG: YceI family protein [Planctomycetaceae bacterium]|nr:YceI family protein [Planctomycetaceae bacterium]
MAQSPCDKPDPRVGSFEKFTGTAEVDPEAKTLKSVSVDIETASLKSEIANLTNHLNSADFFDTREYPKATFKSTRIESGGAGQATITGELTMHGVTKEITFPAEVTISDDGWMVKAEFVIDRTEFDIGKGMDRVEKDVTITVNVNGDSSTSADAGSPPAGGADGDANS